MKIAHVTTVAVSLRGLLLNQLQSLRDEGYEVVGISSPGSDVATIEAAGLRHIPVSISRNLTPLADLVSLWRLYRVMRRERFTIVHTHTPKAGLLGQLAARLAGVPVVVNTVHGFYFHEHMRPAARRFYIWMEKIAACCSHLILSQNAEDIQTALKEGICKEGKIKLLGNGIDLTQFDPARVSDEEVRRLRIGLGLPDGVPVVGFVGRLAAKRKGVGDLLRAAREVAARLPEARFLFVGDADRGKPDAVEPSAAADFGIADRCVFVGHRGNAELPAFYRLMDVLVLPSLFEGVPRVVMEASAMGTPCVVTDVKGNREAVTHDRNGLLVPLGDVPALAAAILRILHEPDTARRMSVEARQRAAERFDERLVFDRVKAHYTSLFRERGQPLPIRGERERVESSAGEIFDEFFRRLEARGIPYVILHGYEDFPARFNSDVDYAVRDADMPKIGPLLAAIARERGWVIAQRWQHELFAAYSVLINPEGAGNHLALDACSHFTKGRCLLLRDTVLLEERLRHERGFFIPAPASEFIYLLAKSLGKNTPVANHLPRLQELWALDPAGAQRQFGELFGETGSALEERLHQPSHEWEPLRATMRGRTRYGPALLVAETFRRFRRALHPAGMHIALLGPDGSGKTTLLQNLERLLAPCFSRQRVFKFRPDVFNRIEPGTEPRPHDRPPRGRVVSWAKIIYYFADWWLGLFSRLLPERRRGALVVFDRDFNDLVIDQRRYLVQGVGALGQVLRRFVPRADATFILDADPQTVHARKPELPVAELARQRQAFRKLAAGDPRMHLVRADEPAEEVARVVSREVILLLGEREQRRSRPVAKRLFDVMLTASALVLLSPLLAVVALLVRVKLGAPILFKQPRPGWHGRPFTIRKFRTMTDARDAAGRLLPDAERLTRFGKFLRSTSLDELPELLNVLRGEMSLVGPRPLLMEYLPLYSAEQRRRHDVLPGITGWAQINGRNAANWPRKFALDLWYVDHQSLWLDLKIIALTFWTVLKREGISQPGRATADRFRGGDECETAVTNL